MIDLHNHLLWGLDDGPADAAGSAAMLAAARTAGVAEIVCTPHFFHPGFPGLHPADARKRLAEVQPLADIRLWPGGEHYVSTELVEAVASGAGSGFQPIHELFLLIEFGPFSQPNHALIVVQRLRSAGYHPILAHPERYQSGRRLFGWTAALKESGCLFVVNGRSLAGADGRTNQRSTRDLIARGIVHGVASDAHVPADLAIHLPDSHAWVEREFGDRAAKLLFLVNPWLICRGRMPLDYADTDGLECLLAKGGFSV